MMNKNLRPITIAIDGFSSSGKSTMAKKLAKTIGYAYIDSGAMYRAVTLYAIRNGMFNGFDLDTGRLTAALPEITISFRVGDSGKTETWMNGECVEPLIRRMEVSSRVSIVAAVTAVRRAMVAQQQKFGEDKRIVMDGRDIGTVVFPNAEMKVYVNASPETRAQRRFDELKAKGDTETTYEQVLENVKQRDLIDTTRADSPLCKAHDAVSLDNSNMTIQEQDTWLLNLYNKVASK